MAYRGEGSVDTVVFGVMLVCVVVIGILLYEHVQLEDQLTECLRR